MQFTCLLKGVDHKFLDISRIAMKHKPKDISVSLGFRSQALTLNLISAKTSGTFLRPWAYKQTLLNIDRRLHSKDKNIFQENIGETSSLIYSPFYIKNNLLFDGVLNKPVGPVADNEINIETPNTCRPEKEISFVPGLCPSCGWDLEGNSDSFVMVCRNCETLWHAHGSELAKIKFGCAKVNNENDALLPFWKIDADISIIDLKSYSDLIKLANLPKVPKPDSENQCLSFWVPAFKIRPKIFLRLITQLAVLQPEDDYGEQLGNHTLSTANLPSSEAVETIKVTIGALMKPAKQYIPILSKINVKPTAIKLIYLPFESKAQDLYHSKLGVSINKNSLKLSGNL